MAIDSSLPFLSPILPDSGSGQVKPKSSQRIVDIGRGSCNLK